MFHITPDFVDGGATGELIVSQPKLIPAPINTLNVDLLNMDAPGGAAITDPLTTLVQRAIDLGLSQIEAAGEAGVLDLAHPDGLSALVGVPAVLDPGTGKYPRPLVKFFDRKINLFETGFLAAIEQERQDFSSIQDQTVATADLLNV